MAEVEAIADEPARAEQETHSGTALAQLQLPSATDEIVPFRVSVPASAISDLAVRLAQTRWPSREVAGDGADGVPLARAQALVEYWRTGYDWRRCEEALNAVPNFRTRIDGLGIHFIHVRSPHPDALPLILTHGWPGSVIEFLKVIGPLTDPVRHGGRAEDAFHLVIPSLPGFGFSDKPEAAGWNLERIARAWAVLMQRLGYRRWVAQGGDIGGMMTHVLARQRPEGMVAAHVNFLMVVPEAPSAQPTDEEQRAFAALGRYMQDGIGYLRLQATRPQTLGYALADSPAGQAAWIYEKFVEWTDDQAGPLGGLTLDEVLDNIAVYWFTDTGASSARLYKEMAHMTLSFGRIELPMAASVFPRESVYVPPRSWAEAQWPNLIYWNVAERGGHFAAFEQPEIFTNELRKAFRAQR